MYICIYVYIDALVLNYTAENFANLENLKKLNNFFVFCNTKIILISNDRGIFISYACIIETEI